MYTMSQSYFTVTEFQKVNIGTLQKPTSTLTADGAIDPSLSGSTIFLKPQSDTTAVSVTLPRAAPGLNFNFVVSGTAANHSIASPTANIVGSIQTSETTAGVSLLISTPKTSVTTGAGSKVGDTLSFVSDGEKWFLSGAASTFTAVTYA